MKCNHQSFRVAVHRRDVTLHILVQIVEAEREAEQQETVDGGKCENVADDHLVDHDHERTRYGHDSGIEQQVNPSARHGQYNKRILHIARRYARRVAKRHEAKRNCRQN